MSKYFWVLLCICYGLNATDLSGRIDSDTNLSMDNSPYYLVSDLEVKSGVTLAIDEGVEIYGNNHAIKVWGILSLKGTPTNIVKIENTHLQRGDNAVNCQITLKYINMDGGDLYQNSGSGSSYCSMSIYDSVLKNISYTYFWYPQIDSYIERNIFLNSGGLSMGVSGPHLYIRNNVFINQTTNYAIEVWANYSNSITVEKNSFISTDKVALNVKYDSGKFDAPNNFWNTTNTAVIDSMITDQNDDLAKVDVIEYTPILISADVNTPNYEQYLNKIDINLTTNNSIMDTLSFDINIVPISGTTISKKQYSFDGATYVIFDSTTISKKFNTAGNHSLKIKVTNSNGLETEKSMSFFVNDISISDLKIIDKTLIDSISNGWYLLGTAIKITDMSVFNNVKIVWFYDSGVWKAYSNVLQTQESMAQSQVPFLTNIPAGSGFWLLK